MTPARKAWLAGLLWLALAVVVWNVIFDRVLVLAGRRYVAAAYQSARTGTYLRIDDAMRPAVRRGLWLASAAAVPIALAGGAGVWIGLRRQRRSTSSKNDSARGSFD